MPGVMFPHRVGVNADAVHYPGGLNGFGERPQPPEDTVPREEYDALKAKYEELAAAVKDLAERV